MASCAATLLVPAGEPVPTAAKARTMTASSASHQSPLQSAVAAAAAPAAGRRKAHQSSGSGARLDRIETGVNRIIAILVRQQQQNLSRGLEVEEASADGHGPTPAPLPEAYSSTSSRHASCESVHEDFGGGGSGSKDDAAYWRRRSTELQDTVDMLVGRLESQAAQLDARLGEAQRQREAAAEERQELLRRLGSFRQQLDASQAARARLHSALEAAEAELARLRKAGSGGGDASNDMEETVEALTAQLDLSNQQLLDMERSRDSLWAQLREGGGGGGGLVRSCSCDQRLHRCCTHADQQPGQPEKQRPGDPRQHLSDHGELSGDSARSSKIFRFKRFSRQAKSRSRESDV